ncbi:MAG: gliding motility lipoprotein GldJ, partial [Flavobacteriaceae bacterium]|nr:gliding motility lipoprotein GldJ [Flavobacteriaceae bacterium]
MRTSVAFKILFTIAIGAGIFSCNKSNNKDNSRATGWDVNSKDGGFQYNTDYEEQETGPGLVFVVGGTYPMGSVQDDPMHDWNNTPNQQHLSLIQLSETTRPNVI